jgi:hypothetical protein
VTEDSRLHRLYNRARLADREVNELLGLTHGITADGVITPVEVEYLHKWLVAHTVGAANPVVAALLGRVDAILADGAVAPEEAADLFSVLQQFAAGDFEVGEMLKATTLPLDIPPPPIRFPRPASASLVRSHLALEKSASQPSRRKAAYAVRSPKRPATL